MKTIRVSRDTKGYRKEVRVAKDIKSREYSEAIQRVKPVYITQERCTSI